MAEFLGPSFERWAKENKKDISYLTRARKVAAGKPEDDEDEATPAPKAIAPVAAPEEPQEREVATTPVEPEDLPVVEPPKPEFGHTLNKDMVWQAIIGAAPAILGAALGGNTGGAAGANVGVSTLQDMRKERLDLEKEQAAQDFKREALDVNKAKVKVAAVAAGQKLSRQAQQDQLAKDRFAETKRHNNATETIIGQKMDVANSKDLQNGYMKDPIVVKANEALKGVKEAKGLIASGKASDATQVQLKLAAIYNQGRPSDQDFKAVKGSQGYWDQLERWALKGFGDKISATDLAHIKRTLDVMEQVNTKARAAVRQQWITLGASRLRQAPAAIERILPESLEGTYSSEQESEADKEDLINQILNMSVE